jgi:hypothetical protein
MKMATLVLLLAGACAEPPQTYRDLDRLGRNYQRDASAPTQTPEAATAADSCGAHRFQALLGTRADQIGAGVLPPGVLPQGARILTPDMMVTMDFSAQRLNIIVGTDGLVGSLRCF